MNTRFLLKYSGLYLKFSAAMRVCGDDVLVPLYWCLLYKT